MNDISNIMGNITLLIAIFGGGLAAVAVGYAGIQWMTAQGDPQKIAQVRMGVIGALGGLVLVGVAFIIPRVVSQLVVEPSGGITFDWDVGFNCDQVLRDQLVVRRPASDAARMNSLINAIQSQQDSCDSEIWNPFVKDLVAHTGTTCFGAQTTVFPGATSAIARLKVGSSFVPRGLRYETSATMSTIQVTSGRDAHNNIIVYWHSTHTDPALNPPGTYPADGSKCWMYVSHLNVWSENY